VRGKPASTNHRARVRWSRRYGYPLRLASCFLVVAIAAFLIEAFEEWEPQGDIFWVANGALLAYLLLAPRWRWPAYLTAGFLALALRIVFMPHRWNEFLLYGLLDMIEVFTAAMLLRGRSTVLPSFNERSYLVRFAVNAGLVGPALAASLYALIYPLCGIATPEHPFLSWMASDSLGIVIATPAFVAVFRMRFKGHVSWRNNWIYPALLLAVTFAAFTQNTFPLVYLIYPLLVLVLLRMGQGYASLSMLPVGAIVGGCTLRGTGPFAAAGIHNPAAPALLIQVAIGSAMFMIYSVSVVVESQKVTESRLRQIVTLHDLLTENSRDAIILADFKGRRSYVSAATERMAGWKPQELARQATFELVHPDDRYKAEAVMRELRRGSDGSMTECRVRKRNGEYIWVEASLRIVRDPKTGAPTGVLNLVRDISERKRAEQQLQQAYRTVEALAVTDPLTGIANRRRFDQYLACEWRRALREHTQLSLLMIDADLFKVFNDTYGHPRGDSCLKQIAEAAQDVVARPGDLVARIGGEEFAVILPSTSSEGAQQVANEICEALRSRKLVHSGSPAGIVTVSVGCGTLVPTVGKHPVHLIELADQALYAAKRAGRNQVCIGHQQANAAEETPKRESLNSPAA
jgi:diguanylate cyclase (GGDEF)-like protein/PAS domain S-box-containing protein